MPNLLEADFVVDSNDQYHKIADKIKEEVGSLDPKRIFADWNQWLQRAVKKISMK